MTFNLYPTWRDFDHALDHYERSIGELRYADVLTVEHHPWRFWNLPNGALALEQATSLLAGEKIGSPHGYGLLRPAPIPEFLKFPDCPQEDQSESFHWFRSKPKPGELTTEAKQKIQARAKSLQHRTDALRQDFEDQLKKESKRLTALRSACEQNEKSAIQLLMSISHLRHWLPDPLRQSFETNIDTSARVALCTIGIPDFNSLNIVKKRGKSSDWAPTSANEKTRATETILYALCLRAAYLIALSNEGNWFDTIAINAEQRWNDRATGLARKGIIASLQAPTEDLIRLRIDQVDPKTCFRHLAGISTPSVEDVSPVRPIFVMNKDDDRIVKDRDVAQGLQPEANLAAMPWEDFEHLVRQLFEWEFAKNGAEVKVTRASRDRGVDAIVFDPDPLRGGKYIIQAKRYTRLVDVASVRDLYGTVVNEGANRGILVTTSSYGPDAYDFVKDKPLSLVDGPNLIAMLRKHGRRYSIDLEEARRFAASNDTD